MEVQIQTYVFFDLETTGMFEGAVAPKITEMALVAVSRESICKTNKQNSLPRILHKLVLPVNPKKTIPSKVEYMTKLCNDDMLSLQPFDSGLFELITLFLCRLTSPICFVAHNGDAFDYPLLLSELNCINVVLCDTILCIDTYKMFKDYYKEISNNTASHTLHAREIDDLLNDGYNESLSAVLDSVMMEKKTVAQNIATTSLQRQDNQETPTSQKTKQQDIIDRPTKKNIHRRLEFGCERMSPVNFKLASIYEHMFDSNFENAHSAEADCLAMLRCVTQIIDYFLIWSHNNASPLVFCKKTHNHRNKKKII